VGYVGEVIQTSAGNLGNCKAIIHVVCPVFTSDEMNILEAALADGLKYAATKGFKSIAIPAIGTGRKYYYSF
jgi:O-acetyl-ADP-ribose deacetylase (regulator of RNase III)